MNRETYLREKWIRYPAMTSDASDARFAAGSRVLYGRIHALTDKEMVLGWAGRTLSLDMPAQGILGEFDETGVFRPHGAPLRVLAAGDLVRVEQVEGALRAVQLLVPSFSGARGGEAIAPSVEAGRRWQKWIAAVREFFSEKAFIEVETPYLVPAPGAEEHLRFFATEWTFGSERSAVYLPTSPELHLKKLLASGFDRIFEIKTCFRNEELSPLHQPEFSMLEWYRAFSTIEKIMEDLDGLIAFLQKKGFGGGGAERNIERVSVARLFREILQVELTPATGRDALLDWVKRCSLDWRDDDSWDDLFFRLMIERIEPALAGRGGVIVYDYPPSQCALARVSAEGWARRFEFYWRGLEIANAFDELNDPEEQAKRLAEVGEKRRKNGYEELPLDGRFLAALEFGMPPSGGIALGLERLFMAMEKVPTIEKVKLFPHRRVRD